MSDAAPTQPEQNSAQQNAQAYAVAAKDNVVNSECIQHAHVFQLLTPNSCFCHHAIHQQQSDHAGFEERLGPVGTSVQAEASRTGNDFQELYNSRQIPEETAANGQKLTQYHSFFYRLLSWQNPRATAITFVANILFIFAARYMNILSYIFKFSFIILGVTSGLEIAGKVLFDDGLASKMRPRQYWTVPRDSLERSLTDVEQLINFFVIETQRILYAENVYATLATFTAAFLSYGLIKLVPFWGLALISTFVIYLGPLIYIKNRETIDANLNHASDVITSQASQLRQMTAEKTQNATKTVQSYAGEYSSKAQEYMGAKKAQVSNATSDAASRASQATSDAADKANEAANDASKKTGFENSVNGSDFPSAPKQDPETVNPIAQTAGTSQVDAGDYPAVPKQEPVDSATVNPAAAVAGTAE